MRIGRRGPSAFVTELVMVASFLRMRAISSFSFDAGMSTRECFAEIALRIRVSMSAIGSVITQTPKTGVGCWVLGFGGAAMNPTPKTQHPKPSLLPARLDDARNLPLERKLAEADAAQFELAQVAARSPAALAARVGARGDRKSVV